MKKIGEGICFKFLNRKWGDVRSSARKESQALIELEEKARLQKGSVGLFYEQGWRRYLLQVLKLEVHWREVLC